MIQLKRIGKLHANILPSGSLVNNLIVSSKSSSVKHSVCQLSFSRVISSSCYHSLSSRLIVNEFITNLKPRSSSSQATLLNSQRINPIIQPHLCYFSSCSGDEENYDSDVEDDELDVNNSPLFANCYRDHVETLKKELSKTDNIDKLFELIAQHIEYAGRNNIGLFILRIAQLTDNRKPQPVKLTKKQIDFLSQLVFSNIKVLSDSRLLSLLCVTLNNQLPVDHKLVTVVLQEIRRRLKNININQLIWLWKTCGYKLRKSTNHTEWNNLRDELVTVVEQRVNELQYDFQNVAVVSQLARILLNKTSSAPYLQRLIKNISIFIEAVDYELAWTILGYFVNLSSRRHEKLSSQELTSILEKCCQVVADKLYENNYALDSLIEDVFINRIVNNNEIQFTYNKVLFDALKQCVLRNQKELGGLTYAKCIYFFAANNYFPQDLIENFCLWIKKHPETYIYNSDFNPVDILNALSEARFFEFSSSPASSEADTLFLSPSLPKQPRKSQVNWSELSKILLDPIKLVSLNVLDRFKLLSLLIIMGDYSNIKLFYPEFDNLFLEMGINRPFWLAYHTVYAGLCRLKEPIEAKLIIESLSKYKAKARKTFLFTEKKKYSDEYDQLLASAVGGINKFIKAAWSDSSIFLNYSVIWNKQGDIIENRTWGKNHVTILSNEVNTKNSLIAVVFFLTEKCFLNEPSILKGTVNFNLKIIERDGFIPVLIDTRNWEESSDDEKITLIRDKINNAREKLLARLKTTKKSNNKTVHG